MKKRLPMKLAWLALAVLFTLAVTSAASAQDGSKYILPGQFDENGMLKPLADGFPSKPITIVNVDDPGTRDGIYGRTYQKTLKGISPVDILISDEPAPTFGNFYALNEIMKRKGGKEGYYPQIVTVWGMTTDTLAEPITKELGLDISDMNMVIVTETFPYCMAQQKNAPWGRTFADFVKYAKANPGKLRYVSNEVGSGNDTACEWVMQQLDLKVNKIPQASTDACLSAIGAGRADFTLAPADYIQPHWEAGRVEVTMVLGTSVPRPWDKDPKVVTSVKAGLPNVPMGIVTGFCVPKTVPPSHVYWLYELFTAGAAQPLHLKREENIIGLTWNHMTPQQGNQLKMKLWKYADPVIRKLGLHVDQK